MNVSTVPNFFISQPAQWWYREGAGEPSVPTVAEKMAMIFVYEPSDNTSEGMFAPIHEACLDITQRICQIRPAQQQASDSEMPKSLEEFCDALKQRRWRNASKPDVSVWEDSYYANSGGIEWQHGYYGARRFWADEWNTERGWEVGTASSIDLPY